MWHLKYEFYQKFFLYCSKGVSFTQNSQQGYKKSIYSLNIFEIPVAIYSFLIPTKVHLQTQKMQSQLNWLIQKYFRSLSSELFTTVSQFHFPILYSVVKRLKKYISVFQKTRFLLKLKHIKKMICLC